MRYGLVNDRGRPVFVRKLYIDGGLVVNPTHEMWLSQGLRPIAGANPPKAEPGYGYVFDKCVESKRVIRVVWKKVERPQTARGGDASGETGVAQ